MHARLSMDKCGPFAEFALQRSAVGFKVYGGDTAFRLPFVCIYSAYIHVEVNAL